MDPLKDIGEIAELLGVSRSTAFRMKKADNWPHVRLGTLIKFTDNDYQAIVQMYHQEPKQKVTPTVGTRARKARNNK